MKLNLMDGPIPGENFTSDTKNYPWHRPPDITDLDEAIEASMKKLSTKEGSFSLITALKSGISVVDMASIFVISAVGSGKWTPDFALLLVGPIAHMMKIMADGYGLEYSMGLDDDDPRTAEWVNELKQLDTRRVSKAVDAVEASIEEITEKANAQKKTGFMSPVQEPINMEGVI